VPDGRAKAAALYVTVEEARGFGVKGLAQVVVQVSVCASCVERSVCGDRRSRCSR
jgi:hypothetical protein